MMPFTPETNYDGHPVIINNQRFPLLLLLARLELDGLNRAKFNDDCYQVDVLAGVHFCDLEQVSIAYLLGLLGVVVSDGWNLRVIIT